MTMKSSFNAFTDSVQRLFTCYKKRKKVYIDYNIFQQYEEHLTQLFNNFTDKRGNWHLFLIISLSVYIQLTFDLRFQYPLHMCQHQLTTSISLSILYPSFMTWWIPFLNIIPCASIKMGNTLNVQMLTGNHPFNLKVINHNSNMMYPLKHYFCHCRVHNLNSWSTGLKFRSIFTWLWPPLWGMNHIHWLISAVYAISQ